MMYYLHLELMEIIISVEIQIDSKKLFGAIQKTQIHLGNNVFLWAILNSKIVIKSNF